MATCHEKRAFWSTDSISDKTFWFRLSYSISSLILSSGLKIIGDGNPDNNLESPSIWVSSVNGILQNSYSVTEEWNLSFRCTRHHVRYMTKVAHQNAGQFTLNKLFGTGSAAQYRRSRQWKGFSVYYQKAAASEWNIITCMRDYRRGVDW
jgi:hypothetical protein